MLLDSASLPPGYTTINPYPSEPGSGGALGLPYQLGMGHRPGGLEVPRAEYLLGVEFVQVRVKTGLAEFQSAIARPYLVDLEILRRDQQELLNGLAVLLGRGELSDLQKVSSHKLGERVLKGLGTARRRRACDVVAPRKLAAVIYEGEKLGREI